MSRGREEREAGFSEYVAARRTQLRRIAYAICGDWHQADDVLQVALTKLYVAWPRVRRGTGSGDGAGGPDAYVRRIIVRAHIDDTRRPWRRERPGLDGYDRAARDGVGPEDRSALFDALQELPPMQRRTVLLRHWLGLSVAETAAELGIAEGTVKSHDSRARERLQQVLDPHPG